MIIYDTEVILNEKKNKYFSFFLFFYKKDSFFRTITVRDFVRNKLTLVCLLLPRCHLVSRNAKKICKPNYAAHTEAFICL